MTILFFDPNGVLCAELDNENGTFAVFDCEKSAEAVCEWLRGRWATRCAEINQGDREGYTQFQFDQVPTVVEDRSNYDEIMVLNEPVFNRFIF